MARTMTGDEGSDTYDLVDTVDEVDEDVLVLPWWQRPANILTLLVATALIAGMIGWLVHDTVSEPDAGDLEVGFLQDMRFHHEQAFQIGMIYLDRPDTDPGLRVVARTIVFGQSIEIGRMIELLRGFEAPEAGEDDTAMEWMGMGTALDAMPGLATEAQLDELAAASGNTADRLFVELMTAHHEGGIDMADFAAANATDDDVEAFANSMVVGQRGEIVELQGLLEP
ncbi:MAG: DUF305 domain-containing protein [Actinomycetota bacterium]|nr:DUF305 domain-containing protein [Actinomycetota bacterium]